MIYDRCLLDDYYNFMYTFCKAHDDVFTSVFDCVKNLNLLLHLGHSWQLLYVGLNEHRQLKPLDPLGVMSKSIK